MKEKKVFIYCRVFHKEMNFFLDYQEEKLNQFADSLGFEVVAVAKEISAGRDFTTFAVQKLLHFVVSQKVNYVFVYDETRMQIFQDFYREFLILCDCFDVTVFTLNDLQKLTNDDESINSHAE